MTTHCSRTDAYYDEDIIPFLCMFPSKRSRHEKRLVKLGWKCKKVEYECRDSIVCNFKGSTDDVIHPRVYVTYVRKIPSD